MLNLIFKNIRSYFRSQRYTQINNEFNLNFSGLVLDLGGGPASFLASQHPHPERVVLVEIQEDEAFIAKARIPQLQVVIANGEEMPFVDQGFVVTISNSVIEHVNRQQKFADELRRVSRSYFLQTPNGNFFIEPHSFVGIPFYRMMTKKTRQLMCKLFRGDFDYIESVVYVTENNLRLMFPDAELRYEKIFGLVKSYYVVKRSL